MKKTLLIVMCCLMAILAPLQAQFGIPNPVFVLGGTIAVPGSASEWTQLANHVELVSQVFQTINIFKQAVESFLFAKKQAEHLFGSSYKSSWKTWLQASSRDTYGHNGGFTGNINGQIGGLSGSLRQLPDFSQVMGKLHGLTMDRISWQYAQAELDDGVAQYALDTAGEVHGNDQKAALDAMDGVVFSDDDDSNTAVMEAHKTAMGVAIAAHQNEDVKRLLTAIAAQQAVDLKRNRDVLEQAVSNHWEWLVRAQKMEPESYLGNASVRIDNFAY